MGLSSVLLCKECTPWQWLLLTISLLTCWDLSTTDHITIRSVPPQVVSGENVLFLVHNVPEDILAFAWYKGKAIMKHGISLYSRHMNLSVTGFAHSGRETIYRNGSLLLERVTEQDSGIYTLQTIDRQLNIGSTTIMRLHVYPFLWTCGRHDTSSKPTIESVPPSIAEGGSVLLLVHNPPENIIAFSWFKQLIAFKKTKVAKYYVDRKSTVWGPAYSGRETLLSDGSLMLHGVTKKDSGLYTLKILRKDKTHEETQVQLQVHTFPSPCCISLTSSQLIIDVVPQYANERDRVLFQVHKLPEDLKAFSWYKLVYRDQVIKIVEYSRTTTSTSWGPGYGRRGMVLYDGSLMLQGVTEKDAGIYMLEVLNKESKIEKSYVKFYVKRYAVGREAAIGEDISPLFTRREEDLCWDSQSQMSRAENLAQPFVQITDSTIAGRRSVIFTCISRDTDVSIRWIFNNQSMNHLQRMTLSPTKCGLRISPVRSDDAGEYQCVVSKGISSKTSLPVSWP
ncbi:pregnancy-specific glycoprotein 22-like [Mesocricetus auratus]|uniref:Pregnancy-specific glycoprotein 22-like n=1 Tax=Mesocricetus auratus TaxID=10036 RepID=A0A1U7QM99_MESAU|nr:pregnancy-specific glycoprotein 22-like [Mesocricetus auratus]